MVSVSVWLPRFYSSLSSFLDYSLYFLLLRPVPIYCRLYRQQIVIVVYFAPLFTLIYFTVLSILCPLRSIVYNGFFISRWHLSHNKSLSLNLEFVMTNWFAMHRTTNISTLSFLISSPYTPRCYSYSQVVPSHSAISIYISTFHTALYLFQ